jgi:hypothetical protein
MGLSLSSRGCFADLESPFPQAWLNQQKGEFNVPTYHGRVNSKPRPESFQRFRKKPKPENRLAGFVQHVQPPFGIFRQSGDNILCQIGAQSECHFSRGVAVAQDILDGGDFGQLVLLNSEHETRHSVTLEPQ